MPKKYSPTGDQLSEHITEADALVADADDRLAMLVKALNAAGSTQIAFWIEREKEKLAGARKHLRAAEAIRLELSARRQAALSREAKKRSE